MAVPWHSRRTAMKMLQGELGKMHSGTAGVGWGGDRMHTGTVRGGRGKMYTGSLGGGRGQDAYRHRRGGGLGVGALVYGVAGTMGIFPEREIPFLRLRESV